MSKEMTPEEALQMIQDNLTPRILGILTVEFNIVEKALNSVEETNFNYHNALAFCEASKEEKQELINKNLELQKENQELLMVIENKNNEIKNLKKLIHDNPYKKVITWLKNTFEIILDSKVRISDGTDCIQAFPIDLKTNEVLYDLLKEVLLSE